jgi:hypothetical protein
LQVKSSNATPITNSIPDWILPVLIIVVAALAFLRTFYSRYFSKLFTGIANPNLINQMVRDENILVQRASILLNAIFYLVAALFLYLLSGFYRWEIFGLDFGFGRFIFFVVLVAGAYTIRLLVLKSCGYLFGIDREVSVHILNIFLINNVLGIALLPLVALLVFASGISSGLIINLSLVIVAFAFVYRIIRGVLVGLGSPFFSAFYLILYLCALEIAPVAVVLKLASF